MRDLELRKSNTRTIIDLDFFGSCNGNALFYLQITCLTVIAPVGQCTPTRSLDFESMTHNNAYGCRAEESGVPFEAIQLARRERRGGKDKSTFVAEVAC